MDSTFLALGIILLSGLIVIIISNKLKIPAIVPLIITGVILGPQGIKLIDIGIFEHNLKYIISICVAIILFEGGLTLNPNGYKGAPKIIIRLLTVGVLITWIGSAIIIKTLYGFSLEFSFLAGSLIIVTGPTVVTPILLNIKIKEKIHHILHWEAVLIDPIGVFVAIFCFEWLTIQGELLDHIGLFSLRVVLGAIFGYFGGLLAYWLIKKKYIPSEFMNIFVFTVAIVLFVFSEIIVHESGILTIVVAGYVLGWKKPDNIKNIKEFKFELTQLAIAFLFIILAAHINIFDFFSMGSNGIMLVILILFVLRPLVIFTSSIKTSLKFREKLFLSWISPRGVVSASMASLFAVQLISKGYENAAFLRVFTFSIILVSVILQGSTAKILARLLGLNEEKERGWVIVGANRLAIEIANFITSNSSQNCYFVDTNKAAIENAKKQGYEAINANAFNMSEIPFEILSTTDNLLVLTDNTELNKNICTKWSKTLKNENMFYWGDNNTKGEIGKSPGISIFERLPKPSETSFKLEQENITLAVSKYQNFLKTPDNIKLAFSDSDRVCFTDKPVEDKKNAQVLFISHI